MQYKQVHPFLKNATAQSLKNKFAIRIHQDAGPFTKVLSVDVISWSSMHATGSELETKYAALVTSTLRIGEGVRGEGWDYAIKVYINIDLGPQV